MSKEKPILFSTPMVNAILRGNKTMTRRLVKMYEKSDAHPNRQNPTWLRENKTCPYGEVGDILWVRESCVWVMLDHAHDLLEGVKDRNQWVYKASVHEDFMKYAKEKYGYKWKPSIHMPKSACRIFLKITNIKVEKLQDIDSGDAISEGIEFWWSDLFSEYRYKDYANVKSDWRSPISSFQSLWASINGFDSWDENPWVWVIEFEKVNN